MLRRASWPLVVAVIVAALLAACGSGSGAATPAPSLAASALPAGAYTSRAFQPAVTFTLPPGWTNPSDAADYFALQPAGSDATGIHLFRDPQAASQDAACPTAAEAGVGPSRAS